MNGRQRGHGGQTGGRMGAVRDRNGVDARIASKIQVVRRVAYHKRFIPGDARNVHQRQQHRRVRLGEGLVRTPRRDETVRDPMLCQRPRQAAASLTGGHGQKKTALIQVVEHIDNARKQGDVSIADQVMPR